MKGIDLVVAALAVMLVLFTVAYNVRKRMKGESTCGYCSGCADDGAKHARDNEGCCASKHER